VLFGGALGGAGGSVGGGGSEAGYTLITSCSPEECAMAACGAQRHLRVAALWVRLDRRDGKPHYLRHGPRCWALLARSLSQPACAPLRDFLDARVPEALRRNPAPG